MVTPWYSKPYPKGSAVGPAKLPREFYAPSEHKGHFIGPGVLASKRALSRGGRWEPWEPDKWDKAYGDKFAHGRGTGNVGDSGVRGFQKQEGLKPDGILGDQTYQHMRRSHVAEGPHKGEPLFDSECIKLLNAEVKQFGEAAKHEAIFQKGLDSMKLMSRVTPGYLLGGGHGIPIERVSPYWRLDCSSSTSKWLDDAGIFGFNYALSSWEFDQWGVPGVGEYFTIYYNGEHVWTRLYKTLYWRFDTNPAGDGKSPRYGPRLRYLPRWTSSFQTRHWPGM